MLVLRNIIRFFFWIKAYGNFVLYIRNCNHQKIKKIEFLMKNKLFLFKLDLGCFENSKRFNVSNTMALGK